MARDPMDREQKPANIIDGYGYKTDSRFCIFVIFWGSLLCACQTTSEHARKYLNQFDIQTLKKAPETVQSSYKTNKRRKEQKVLVIPSVFKKCVSITITDAVPLKDALIEMAHQVGVNLQLDTKVTDRVVFSANNQPFIDVIKDLCEIVGLRYTIRGQSIRIEIDSPYSKNYAFPFLNMVRTADNQISIATDVFSSVKDNKSSADNGSSSTITGKVNNDFWAELDGNLKIMLQQDASAKDTTPGLSSYSINRQGGLISVYATQRQHTLIEEYISSLRQVVSTQVLIEAKVIEVSLKDQYKGGINWQNFMSSGLHIDMPLGDFAQRGKFTDPTSAQTDMLSFGLQGKNFTEIVKAIEEFGSSRTLSSPRLTVLNNQTAILKVAQNQVYFRLNYDKQLNFAVNRESINVSSDIQTIPIGLVMSVQPSIVRESGEIILYLRPTISRLNHSVSDPAVEIAFANARAHSTVKPKPSLIPVVEVREIDSVLRLQSGEIAVLGGLMESRTTNEAVKLPWAGDLPVIGKLFTSSSDSDEIIELVILLRASIIEDSSMPDAADQRLYHDYSEDPRLVQ